MMFMEVLKSSKITHTNQDENREFLFFLIYIYVNNMVFLSIFVYKGDFGLLQDI